LAPALAVGIAHASRRPASATGTVSINDRREVRGNRVRFMAVLEFSGQRGRC
jgi:hypothetical protein